MCSVLVSQSLSLFNSCACMYSIWQFSWDQFLNVCKFLNGSLIFLQALSFWSLFMCINEKREGIRQRWITVYFSLKWKHWTRMNESRLSSHSLKQICLFTSFYWLWMHLCHLWPSFFPPILSQCTFKHTFLTADSNMLQKMGNCLKLPVLRVRSSMSEKKNSI